MERAAVPALQLQGFDIRKQRHISIAVLHHDERYLVICKPHDLRIDGATEESTTAEQILNEQYAKQRNIPKLYLVHQLDAVTSGVHLWALSSKVTSRSCALVTM